MVIDITRCNGCYNCFLACRDEYCGNDHLPYSKAQPWLGHFWMRIIEKERGKYPQAIRVAYVPLPCLQCDQASCIKSTHNEEIYRRPDGIVMIDPNKATGQKQLVSSCPYGVIYWNEEENIPQKCTFCAHLLDSGWKEPRCVEACPTQALKFGDLDNPNGELAKLIASGKTETLHPEYRMGDKVNYIGLPKRSIAGSVVFEDKDECAEYVHVLLKADNREKVSITNNYGDFEFDGLPENTEYSISIKHPGYGARKFKVTTKTDVYLGDIKLRGKASVNRR
ncbi:4Fe-4S dicluster domain-containing protein [Chloroflexota bacterium]